MAIRLEPNSVSLVVQWYKAHVVSVGVGIGEAHGGAESKERIRVVEDEDQMPPSS